MRGDGRTYLRGRIWWIAYYDNGRECRESSHSQERSVAERLRRQRVGEVAAGKTQSPALKLKAPRSVKAGDLLDLVEQDYRLNGRTGASGRTILRRLRSYFADYTVEACTSLAIAHYMESRQRKGRKPGTINREMNVLRRAFTLGYQHDLISRKPAVPRLPDLAVCNEFFTREDVDLLLPYLPDYLRDVTLFAYLTGWRKGEITGLRWNNVDRKGDVTRLEPAQNKGRDVRVLVLQGELAELIERQWERRRVGRAPAVHVFHRRGHQLKKFWEMWCKACNQSGLGHRLFHSLRRSAARRMALEGIPEKVSMSIMGHKTRAMFDRYNIVTEADQRAFAKRLFGAEHGQ